LVLFWHSKLTDRSLTKTDVLAKEEERPFPGRVRPIWYSDARWRWRFLISASQSGIVPRRRYQPASWRERFVWVSQKVQVMDLSLLSRCWCASSYLARSFQRLHKELYAHIPLLWILCQSAAFLRLCHVQEL